MLLFGVLRHGLYFTNFRHGLCLTNHINFISFVRKCYVICQNLGRLMQGNKFPCYKIGRADGTCISP